jgi:hypothetical protein
MPRFELIPSITTDGRHIIFHAAPIPPRERVRRLAERLRPGRRRGEGEGRK